jgi:molybdate transport system substrate-binding protein
MKKLVLIALLLALAACQSKQPAAPVSPDLIVAAAANLTEVCPELGRKFTDKTGIRVVFSYGATGDLSRQIENGAPFDVFASADSEHVERLDQKGLLTTGSRALYARGRLVMWLPPQAPKAARIEDITAPAFERIAVAKPDVAPYGKATVETLESLKIWKQVEPRVVYGQSVSQTKQFAATGNAEVAFIPLALVKSGEGSYLEVDAALHRPIDQSLGIVKASTHQQAARQFVDFLLSTEGQQILITKGYLSVSPR